MLQNFTIKKKIWFIVILSLIGVVGISITLLWQARNKFIEQRKNAGYDQVQMIMSYLKSLESQVAEGKLSISEAHKMGRDIVNNTAVSRSNYMYIIHTNGGALAHPLLKQSRPSATPEEVAALLSEDAGLTQDEIMKKHGYPGRGLNIPELIARNNDGKFTGFADYAYTVESQFGYRSLTYWGDPYAHPKVEHKLMYGELFEAWDWVVVRAIFISDLEQEFRNWAVSIAVFCIIVISALGVSAYSINLSISKPLVRVIRFMNDISEGSGDLTRRLRSTGRNELSSLSKGFNTFVSKLETIIGSVLNTNASIIEKSQQLSTMVERSAERSKSQLQETEMLASATTQLSASLADVARGAQQSAESARKANQVTAQATEAVSSTRNIVSHLADTMQEIQTKAHDMKNHNQKVNSVVEVIRGIAEQTNLLALNAAIEAARAGDQGRGFAVVADEVRNLAQKTQSSTMEIHEIVEQLQTNTDQVVSVMDDGVRRTQDSVETASNANALLETAIAAVEVILNHNEEIAQSVEQQSQVTDEIANSSLKIANDGKLNDEDYQSCLSLNREANEKLNALKNILDQFKIQKSIDA